MTERHANVARRRVLLGAGLAVVCLVLLAVGVYWWIRSDSASSPNSMPRAKVYLDHVYFEPSASSPRVDLCTVSTGGTQLCTTPHNLSSVVKFDPTFSNPTSSGSNLVLYSDSVTAPFHVSALPYHVTIPAGVNESIDLTLTMPAIGGHFSPTVSFSTS